AVLWAQAPKLSIFVFDDEIAKVVFANDLNGLDTNPTPRLADFFNKAHVMTPNVEVSGLRGFSRRSARLPGWNSLFLALP
ncbi:MAG: hypothetical protein B0A82_12860, partial [Alkalinema sp. CACIAM 70d]